MYSAYKFDVVKFTWFKHNGKIYNSGTKLIFNGMCFVNGSMIFLNNKIVTFEYEKQYISYFKYNNIIYSCPCNEFSKKIVKILSNAKIANNTNKKPTFYWTDEKVSKTLWYIIIMAISIIFNDRIIIWIIATVIWYVSVFKNN